MFSDISVYFTDWLDVTVEELACWYIFVPVKFLYLIMIKLQWGTVNCNTTYPIIIHILKWWYQVFCIKKIQLFKWLECTIYCTGNLWCIRWWFHIILADMLSLKSCIQLHNPTRLDGPHNFHIACPAHIYPSVLDKCISYVIAHMYMAVNVC